jgi:hypothetical protein
VLQLGASRWVEADPALWSSSLQRLSARIVDEHAALCALLQSDAVAVQSPPLTYSDIWRTLCALVASQAHTDDAPLQLTRADFSALFRRRHPLDVHCGLHPVVHLLHAAASGRDDALAALPRDAPGSAPLFELAVAQLRRMHSQQPSTQPSSKSTSPSQSQADVQTAASRAQWRSQAGSTAGSELALSRSLDGTADAASPPSLHSLAAAVRSHWSSEVQHARALVQGQLTSAELDAVMLAFAEAQALQLHRPVPPATPLVACADAAAAADVLAAGGDSSAPFVTLHDSVYLSPPGVAAAMFRLDGEALDVGVVARYLAAHVIPQRQTVPPDPAAAFVGSWTAMGCQDGCVNVPGLTLAEFLEFRRHVDEGLLRASRSDDPVVTAACKRRAIYGTVR